MSLTFSAGDSGKVRASAQAYRALGSAIDTVVEELRTSVGDWRAQSQWTGRASDRAAQAWVTYLDQLTQRAAVYHGFADELDKIAASIDSAVTRARNTLIVSGITFVLATGFAVFTFGASEGAEVLESAAAAAEIADISVGLGEAVSAGFTTVLSQTLIRSAIAVGTSLAIPAGGTELHHLVTGKPWTVQDIDGILIGGSLGLAVGAVAAGAQVIGPEWSTGTQIAYGAGTGAAGGALSSIIGQAALNDSRTINWKIVGYSTGLGGFLGGAAAGTGVAIGNRFKPPNPTTPDQAGLTVELTEVGTGGQPVGEPVLTNIDAVTDPATGRTSLILSDPEGGPVLSEAGLVDVPDADLAGLGASQNRLATAASFTASNAIVSDLERTVGTIDPAAEVNNLPSFTVHDNPTFLAQNLAEAKWLGATLRAQLAELEAVDTGAAQHLASTAPDPLNPATVAAGSSTTAGAGDTAWTALTAHNGLAERIDQTAVEYNQSLQLLRTDIAALQTPPGEPLDITSITGSAPNIDAEMARVQTVYDSVGPLELTGQDGAPAGAAPDLGLNAAEVAEQPRQSTIARIIATSAAGAALASSGAVLTGPGVLPRLEEPPESHFVTPEGAFTTVPSGSFETA